MDYLVPYNIKKDSFPVLFQRIHERRLECLYWIVFFQKFLVLLAQGQTCARHKHSCDPLWRSPQMLAHRMLWVRHRGRDVLPDDLKSPQCTAIPGYCSGREPESQGTERTQLVLCRKGSFPDAETLGHNNGYWFRWSSAGSGAYYPSSHGSVPVLTTLASLPDIWRTVPENEDSRDSGSRSVWWGHKSVTLGLWS